MELYLNKAKQLIGMFKKVKIENIKLWGRYVGQKDNNNRCKDAKINLDRNQDLAEHQT